MLGIGLVFMAIVCLIGAISMGGLFMQHTGRKEDHPAARQEYVQDEPGSSQGIILVDPKAKPLDPLPAEPTEGENEKNYPNKRRMIK